MELTTQERMALVQVIPPQTGGLTKLRIVRKLREDLSFTEEEHKQLNIRVEGDRIFWDAVGEDGKEIEIGEVARGVIVDTLRMLAEKEVLSEEHLSLIEKFPEVEE